MYVTAIEQFALDLCAEMPHNQYVVIATCGSPSAMSWLDFEELRDIVAGLRPDITLARITLAWLSS